YDYLRRKHEGLEMAHFTDVRSALNDFINASNFTRQENQVQLYAELLDDLKEAVKVANQTPSAASNSTLGRILGTLEAAGQVPDLVSDVRSHFGQPNLMARVSNSFIVRNTEQTIDDQREVSEEILGSQQTGEAHTLGTVTLNTVTNPDQAELKAVLEATTTAQNIGRRSIGNLGTIVIHSDSESQATASKSILIDDGHLSSTAARARATTRTKINKVSAPRFISKFATRQVHRKKGKAESIASQRVARRLEDQFDERVSESVGQANDNVTKEVRYPLIRLDAYPEAMNFSTTEEDLNLEVVQAGQFQVGTTDEAPPISDDSDAALVVHQSAINNLAESILGGKTITDRMAAELLEVANQGDLPEEFSVDRTNPWSITLAKYQPVTVELGDSKITVNIRGNRFRRGGSSVNDMIQVSATYHIEKTSKGVKLSREGDVELTYPGKEQLTVEQTAVKSFLLVKFNYLFKDSAETTGVQFPGRFEDKAPMELAVFEMSSGWLSLAWKQAEGEADSSNVAQVSVTE
ncbi:MAG: hypothetical protein VX668_00435, partial [Planctomycetota bacterium]|nr:hypothetical protein [Planctomycetota bacterium]